MIHMAEINSSENIQQGVPEIPKIAPPEDLDRRGVRQERESLGRAIVKEVDSLAQNNAAGVDLSAERSELQNLQSQLVSLSDKKPIAGKVGINKSPQELAAQMIDIPNVGLKFDLGDSGAEADFRYVQWQTKISELLNSGIGDDELIKELDKIYLEGQSLGTYAPVTAERFQEEKKSEIERYKSSGYSEEEAIDLIDKRYGGAGYLAEVRRNRRNSEAEVSRQFGEYTDNHPMDTETEKEIIEDLRKRCIDVEDTEDGYLSDEFPGGNFLYHGTKVAHAISILDSGTLASGKTLIDREKDKAKSEERDVSHIQNNSGYEGISWSFNEIAALPGDRYHLVGFVASPESVLDGDMQLAIPSRPAPNELILINGGINANSYYEAKTQYELMAGFNMGEMNSVLSNLISLSAFREVENSGKKLDMVSDPLLKTFSETDMPDDEMADMLRTKYIKGDDGLIKFSTDLLQQVNNEVPVAAVWIQSLIDSGQISRVKGFEQIKTVREAIAKINDGNIKNFYKLLKENNSPNVRKTETEEDKAGSVEVPVDQMYLVVGKRDLEKWLKIIARSGKTPKGIIVVDHKKVRLEYFASSHRGDQDVLTEELRRVIPKNDGLIDYDEQVLGEKITDEKMAGYKKHVIGEKYLGNRKSIRKSEDGNLIVS
jgi:hypothetical protein